MKQLKTCRCLPDWIAQIASDNLPARIANCAVTLGEFSEAALLVPQLAGKSKEEVIQDLAERLASAGRIRNAPAFLKAALARELQHSTFVGGEAVIPHVRSDDVLKLSVAVGLSADGVPWGKSQAAKIVFLFAVPPSGGQMYLSLLSALARFMTNAKTFSELQRATHPEEMWRALKDAPQPA